MNFVSVARDGTLCGVLLEATKGAVFRFANIMIVIVLGQIGTRHWKIHVF
jgi:hypothetical protein